jgi:hypothetical protein
MARSDWDAVDHRLKELDKSGWEAGSQVIGAAFAILVHRRFDSMLDRDAIAEFVSGVRSSYENGAAMPALEMEAMIRAALGEGHLVDNMEPETMLSVQVTLLGALLQVANLDDVALGSFIAEVEDTAARHI